MLKPLCSVAALAFAAGLPASAFAQAGLSVNIGQPGFYGRLDIGSHVPPPQLIYPEPVLVQPPPHRVQRAPIYLRVPPGHAKHWSRHCARYNACGQPVYFVQDRWYQEVYAPHYRSGSPSGYRRDRDDDDDGRRGRHEGQRRWEREHDHRERDHDHRGRGHGHGHGHDR